MLARRCPNSAFEIGGLLHSGRAWIAVLHPEIDLAIPTCANSFNPNVSVIFGRGVILLIFPGLSRKKIEGIGGLILAGSSNCCEPIPLVAGSVRMVIPSGHCDLSPYKNRLSLPGY